MGNTKTKIHIPPDQLQEYSTISGLSEREVRDFLQVFLSEYPSGEVTKEDFVEENIKAHGGHLQMWNHIFNVLDKDENGLLDAKDFLIACNIGVNGTPEEKLYFAFKVYDIDGNGYIDYFEFSQLFHFTFGNFQISDNSLGSEQDFAMEDKELSEKCRKIFSRLDKNERGKISMPEFVHGLRDDPVMIASFTLF
ncbi:hypothetical protein FDP41_004885 [Naegleria fowleri]|uniref:EF-hand domain-containing protein n=1 Tax=Naegleria fowleri TaxID=5763 RepID=A0A6A5BQT5_NAEFO|nr:uncharacterized protein FDP41_004885 [Naegleria fowleri]KAF0976210.1 hypothetical protein FDP41_004885 [Naegleria fowleri]CAG4715236.1 unnamed protein product [Naegleria fowleri]